MVQFAEVLSNEQIVVSLIRHLSWTHFLASIPLRDPLASAPCEPKSELGAVCDDADGGVAWRYQVSHPVEPMLANVNSTLIRIPIPLLPRSRGRVLSLDVYLGIPGNQGASAKGHVSVRRGDERGDLWAQLADYGFE